MKNPENMSSLVAGIKRDQGVESDFLAKNTLQYKLVEKMYPHSTEIQSDYSAFVEFSNKYGKALHELIQTNRPLAKKILDKVLEDPEAPMSDEDYSTVVALLNQHSGLVH